MSRAMHSDLIQTRGLDAFNTVLDDFTAVPCELIDESHDHLLWIAQLKTVVVKYAAGKDGSERGFEFPHCVSFNFCDRHALFPAPGDVVLSSQTATGIRIKIQCSVAANKIPGAC